MSRNDKLTLEAKKDAQSVIEAILNLQSFARGVSTRRQISILRLTSQLEKQITENFYIKNAKEVINDEEVINDFKLYYTNNLKNYRGNDLTQHRIDTTQLAHYFLFLEQWITKQPAESSVKYSLADCIAEKFSDKKWMENNLSKEEFSKPARGPRQKWIEEDNTNQDLIKRAIDSFLIERLGLENNVSAENTVSNSKDASLTNDEKTAEEKTAYSTSVGNNQLKAIFELTVKNLHTHDKVNKPDEVLNVPKGLQSEPSRKAESVVESDEGSIISQTTQKTKESESNKENKEGVGTQGAAKHNENGNKENQEQLKDKEKEHQKIRVAVETVAQTLFQLPSISLEQKEQIQKVVKLAGEGDNKKSKGHQPVSGALPAAAPAVNPSAGDILSPPGGQAGILPPPPGEPDPSKRTGNQQGSAINLGSNNFATGTGSSEHVPPLPSATGATYSTNPQTSFSDPFAAAGSAGYLPRVPSAFSAPFFPADTGGLFSTQSLLGNVNESHRRIDDLYQIVSGIISQGQGQSSQRSQAEYDTLRDILEQLRRHQNDISAMQLWLENLAATTLQIAQNQSQAQRESGLNANVLNEKIENLEERSKGHFNSLTNQLGRTRDIIDEAKDELKNQNDATRQNFKNRLGETIDDVRGMVDGVKEDVKNQLNSYRTTDIEERKKREDEDQIKKEALDYESGWPKRESFASLALDRYRYLENEAGLVAIPELVGMGDDSMELHKSGLTFPVYHGKSGLKTLSDHVNAASLNADKYPQVAAIAKVYDPKGIGADKESIYCLVTSVPKYGTSVSFLSAQAFESFRIESENLYHNTLIATKKRDALENILLKFKELRGAVTPDNDYEVFEGDSDTSTVISDLSDNSDADIDISVNGDHDDDTTTNATETTTSSERGILAKPKRNLKSIDFQIARLEHIVTNLPSSLDPKDPSPEQRLQRGRNIGEIFAAYRKQAQKVMQTIVDDNEAEAQDIKGKLRKQQEKLTAELSTKTAQDGVYVNHVLQNMIGAIYDDYCDDLVDEMFEPKISAQDRQILLDEAIGDGAKYVKRCLGDLYPSRETVLRAAAQYGVKEIEALMLESENNGLDFSNPQDAELMQHKVEMALAISNASAQDLAKICTAEEKNTARKVASTEMLRITAVRSADAIDQNVGLNKNEIESVAEELGKKLGGWGVIAPSKTTKKAEIADFLTLAKAPSSDKSGPTVFRPARRDDVVTVMFNGPKRTDASLKAGYEGDDIMYVHIRGTGVTNGPAYYVKVQVATGAPQQVEVFKNGKSETRFYNYGDLIIDESTVFTKDPDGGHSAVAVSTLRPSVQQLYSNLKINAMSAIDGERKMSVLYDGKVMSPEINQFKEVHVAKINEEMSIVAKAKFDKDPKNINTTGALYFKKEGQDSEIIRSEEHLKKLYIENNIEEKSRLSWDALKEQDLRFIMHDGKVRTVKQVPDPEVKTSFAVPLSLPRMFNSKNNRVGIAPENGGRA